MLRHDNIWKQKLEFSSALEYLLLMKYAQSLMDVTFGNKKSLNLCNIPSTHLYLFNKIHNCPYVDTGY